MERPLRYGIVGAGRVAQRFHLPAVADHVHFALVAVCDANLEQARATVGAAGAGVLFTERLDEFFESGRPDVVAVCTPNDAHVEPVLAAIAAGAAVLCEKPLARDLPEARRLVAAAAAAGAVVGVNLPYRFHPLLPVFRRELGSGPQRVRLTFTTAGQRLWRPVTRWYNDPARAGGGALLDLGPHALDILTALFGAVEVDRCHLGDGAVEERVEADLRFAEASARLLIDRASRTVGLAVEAQSEGRTVTLDLRRNEVRRPDGVVAKAPGVAIERAAIDRFLDAVAGRGGVIVAAAEALQLQSVIAAMYASAVSLEAGPGAPPG